MFTKVIKSTLGAALFLLVAACGTSSSTTTTTFTLTASGTGGTGAGSITSDVTGISCGSDCTQDFDESTAVVLTATADDGSSFTGWGGDCSGISTCSLTMDADKTITATFSSNSASTNSTSGSLATLSLNTQTLVFVPSGTGIVITELETTAGSSSLSSDLRSSNLVATSTVSFTVNSCAVDVSALKLVCVGYDSSTVAILSLSTYVSNILAGLEADVTDITATEVDLSNTELGSFSGGECINCGVLTDPGDSRFIVSSGDGYRVLDYTGTVLSSYLTDSTLTPARDLATENFTYDSTNNWIISPEYGTSNNYLWLIDLDTDSIYRWTNRMVDIGDDAVEGITGFAAVFSGFEADAATIDSTTGVMVMADENQSGLIAVNLNDATFDDAADTFTAPASIINIENVGSRLPGIAAETTNHFLFGEEEFDSGIGVMALPTTAASGAIAITEYNWADVPDPSATCAGVSFWYNAGDPHGLSLFTSVVSGHSMGLLVNEELSCAAMIDLDALLNTAKETGLNQVDTSLDLVATDVISFISLE